MFEKLKQAILDGNDEIAKIVSKEITVKGTDPLYAINEAVIPAARMAGEKFENGEFFLPQLLLAADAMKAAIDVLTSELSESWRKELGKEGTVVIATVEGDIHDIGKNILALLLEVNGFLIHDLGRDVNSLNIIKKATEVNADIIALSALMTTSMPSQRDVIEFLESMGLRDKFIVMVGGGSVSKEWAIEIGADKFSETADGAVKMAKEILRERGVK